MVQRQELDLAIGDVFRIGDTTITVIDIENGEITFKIDDADLHDCDQIGDDQIGEDRFCSPVDSVTIPLPR